MIWVNSAGSCPPNLLWIQGIARESRAEYIKQSKKINDVIDTKLEGNSKTLLDINNSLINNSNAVSGLVTNVDQLQTNVTTFAQALETISSNITNTTQTLNEHKELIVALNTGIKTLQIHVKSSANALSTMDSNITNAT